MVAVLNFAIHIPFTKHSRSTLLDDKNLFCNLQKIDSESGEPQSAGFILIVICGVCKGCLATLINKLSHGQNLKMNVHPEHQVSSAETAHAINMAQKH